MIPVTHRCDGACHRLLVGFLALVFCSPTLAQDTLGTLADYLDLESQTLILAREFGDLVVFDTPLQALEAVPAVGASNPESDRASEKGGLDVFTASELAAFAMLRNPSLAEARAGISLARADFVGASASRLPRIEGSASATNLANPMDAMLIPAGSLGFIPGVGALPPAAVTLLDAQKPSWYQFKATLTQALFTWGRIDAGISLAETGKSVAALRLEKTGRETLVRIGAAMDALAFMARLDETLRLQARIGERLIFISEQNRKAGFITEGEFIEARIDVKKLDLARAELASRTQGLLEELRGLSGDPELGIENLALYTVAAGKPRFATEALRAAAREGSLDLDLAEEMVRAKAQGLSLAKASRSLLPSFGLRAELSYEGSAFPLLEEAWGDEDDWQLTLTLASTLTIFDGGSAHGSVDKAEADLGVARAIADRASAEIESFVRASIQQLVLLRARLEYDDLKLQGHSERLERLRSELLAGAGTESDYLRGLIDALGTVAEGWSHLSEYRAVLWSLEAVLPAQ